MAAGSLFRFEPGSTGTLTRNLRALLDAFIDVVEPVFAGSASRGRPIVVQGPDGTFRQFDPRNGLGELLSPEVGAPPGVMRDVELRLDPDRLVIVQISLPQAALSYADRVIEHRIDRLTPWRPERAVYGFKAGQASGDQVEITIHAASRDMIEAATTRLAKSGCRVVAIGAAEPGDPLEIDLLRGIAGAANGARRRRIAAGAIAILVTSVAFYAGALHLLSSREQALADIQREIAQARAGLVAGAGRGPTDRASQIIAEKTPERAVSLLLDRLAAAIPDTTYLEQLDIGADEIRLAGSSLDASSLPQVLQGIGLGDARFEAAVTRQADGRDWFEMLSQRPAAPGGEGATP